MNTIEDRLRSMASAPVDRPEFETIVSRANGIEQGGSRATFAAIEPLAASVDNASSAEAESDEQAVDDLTVDYLQQRPDGMHLVCAGQHGYQAPDRAQCAGPENGP